MDQGKNSLIAV